jgi:hypothetical protein
MILLVVLSIILLFILWTIFAPMILSVNTDTGDYSLRIPGIFRIRLIIDEDLIYIRARMLLIPFRINPFSVVPSPGMIKREEKKWTGTVNLKYRLQALMELLSSFRLKYLYLDVDTDNILLNAYLYPALLFLRSDRIQCVTNYLERTRVILDMRNRLASLLWIGIKYQYRSYVKP